MKKIYFKNLDAVRFFAAMMVLVHHVEQNKYWMDVPNLWGLPIVDNLGKMACVIFFVLSGFLISYQFLSKIEEGRKISWKAFQQNRARKIWPLYFTVVLFALLVLPRVIDIRNFNDQLAGNFSSQLLIYFTFFPNLSRMLSPVVGINQFWFIGVQEQFYWVWPKLISKIKKYFVPAVFSMIVIKLFTQAVLNWFAFHFEFAVIGQLARVLELFYVEQLLIGALGAYFLKYKAQWIKSVISQPIFLLASTTFVLFMIYPSGFPGYSIANALVVLIILLNLSLGNYSFVKLDSSWVKLGGSISFSMYALHTSVIALIIYHLPVLDSAVWYNVLLYTSSVFSTLVLSFMSHRYFEPIFLKPRRVTGLPVSSK